MVVFTAGSNDGMQTSRKEYQLHLSVHYKNKKHNILGPKITKFSALEVSHLKGHFELQFCVIVFISSDSRNAHLQDHGNRSYSCAQMEISKLESYSLSVDLVGFHVDLSVLYRINAQELSCQTSF